MHRKTHRLRAFQFLGLVLLGLCAGTLVVISGSSRRKISSDKASSAVLEFSRSLKRGAAKSALKDAISFTRRRGNGALESRRRRLQGRHASFRNHLSLEIVHSRTGTECSIPRPPSTCPEYAGERIHMAIVSADSRSDPLFTTRLGILVNSAAMQTNCPLTFHLLTLHPSEKAAARALFERMGLSESFFPPSPAAVAAARNASTKASRQDPSNRRSLLSSSLHSFALHDIPVPLLLNSAKFLSLFPVLSPSGLRGFVKLFLADVLWQIDRVIVLEEDMIVGGDVAGLMRFAPPLFAKDERLLFILASSNFVEGAVPDEEREKRRRRLLLAEAGPGPFSPTVMVMQLDRMRKGRLTQLFRRALIPVDHAWSSFSHGGGAPWLLNLLCHKFPRSCHHLPWTWHVGDARLAGGGVLPLLGQSVLSKSDDGDCWRLAHMHGHHAVLPATLYSHQTPVAVSSSSRKSRNASAVNPYNGLPEDWAHVVATLSSGVAIQ